MIKQLLLLIGVIAVFLAGLLCSLYVLDLIKAAELQDDLRKLFGLMAIAAVASVAIIFLVKAAEKK